MDSVDKSGIRNCGETYLGLLLVLRRSGECGKIVHPTVPSQNTKNDKIGIKTTPFRRGYESELQKAFSAIPHSEFRIPHFQWHPPQVEQSWVQFEGISPVMAKVMVLLTAFINSFTASCAALSST